MPTKFQFHHFLQHQWQVRGWWSILCRPFSWLAHRFARRKKEKTKGWKAPVPIVVVGNIYVGGTGKTPVVLGLIRDLKARGWTPGVVSRGYGVRIQGAPRVSPRLTKSPSPTELSAPKKAGWDCMSADQVGDEPALISQYAPIAVHPQRVEAVKALLAEHPEVNVVITDDGLQHYALARDVEIVVQDARGVGNGLMLPAGPLREPPERLESVDFVLNNVPHPTHACTDSALSFYLEPCGLRHLKTGERCSMADFARQYAHTQVHAFAGIGHPQRFFDTLNALPWTLSINTTAFPDHYAYRAADLHALAGNLLIMTEKDAVKCAPFADDRCWALCVEAQWSDLNWVDRLLSKINTHAAQ